MKTIETKMKKEVKTLDKITYRDLCTSRGREKNEIEFFRFRLKNTHNNQLLGGFFSLKIEDYSLFYMFIDSCKGLL